MEFENLGFISALREDDQFNVRVINIFSNPENYPSLDFQIARPAFGEILRLFLHLRFIKIFIKFNGDLQKSLVNVFLNFPELLSSYLSREIEATDICFASVRPGNFLGYVHQLARDKQKLFVYHEISKFNEKYLPFFQKLNDYGVYLISAIEKKEYLLQNFSGSKFCEIRQWIYQGQGDFLEMTKPSAKDQVFGTVSRLDYGKNIDLIFSAMSILKRRGKKPKLRLFGDGPELPRLKTLVKSCEIESQVSFMGGFGFDERVQVFKNIDILIVPSLFEGGPITILEAMAAARPIISTNVGDVRNRIIPGFNGLILNSMNSPEELADSMSFYLDHPENIPLHGENSREKYMSEFEEEIGKRLFVDTIRKISKYPVAR